MKKISKRLIVTGLVAIVMIAFLVYFNLVSSEEADQKLPTVEVEKDIVTLRGFTIGNKPVDGMEEFYQQLDALTIPDLGCKVRFDYIPWGDEKNKIDLNIASGQYDLYVGGVFSNYKETALKNAFLDLKPYLELVPDLVSHYTQVSEHSLTLCEINGKLFGIPQFARVEKGADEGFIYREDLRKEWGLPEINSLETMEMYLYAAKSDERYKDKPLLTDNRIYTSLWLILTGHKYRLLDNYYTCYEYDNPTKLLKVHETPEWKEVCQYAKKWYDDGIISYDILVVSGNEGAKGRELMLKDMKPCEANVPYWSATVNWIPILYDKHPEWDIGFYDYLLDNPQYKNAYIPDTSKATAISIAAHCEYPEIAIKFIEKAHTDQTYYDLLKYGVEGIHYKMIDGLLSIADIPQENILPGWTGLTDDYMSYPSRSINPNWQQIGDKYLEKGNGLLENMGYIASPDAGFTFITVGLTEVIAAIEGVKNQYMLPLAVGVSKDIEGDLEKLQYEYEKAGFQIYYDELERQWESYLSGK